MATYSVQQVVATGCTDLLVAFRLTLPEPVWEVTSIQKTVLVDRLDPTLGSVLLQGRLRAGYTVAVPMGLPPPPGALLRSSLQLLSVDLPFQTALAIPKSEPAMQVTLTAAYTIDQVVRPVIESGLIAGLDDQSLLYLAVRLSRTVELHIPDPPQAEVQPPPQIGPPLKPSGFTRFQSRPSR